MTIAEFYCFHIDLVVLYGLQIKCFEIWRRGVFLFPFSSHFGWIITTFQILLQLML